MNLLRARVFTDPSNTTYAERCNALVGYYARRESGDYYARVGMIEIASRLRRRRPMNDILPFLNKLLDEDEGDMFWMYPMVAVHYEGAKRLPAETLALMRDRWRTYTPYRGDTENHWVMYYAALYLICQFYPDDPADSWFNGKSSAENMEEARGFLFHWIDLTTTRGQGEFDSPHYLPFFLTPLAQLYAYVEDEEIKQAAQMMLDYLIADFAVDTLDGLFAGAFSRIYPAPLLERWRNGSTTYAWLLFGNVPFRPDAVNVVLPRVGYRPHGTAALMAMSGYEPPPVLTGIACDRSTPYAHRELKRTRHRIRYSDVRDAPVYKSLYMTRDYAVGSIQGGLIQPIQQHTWEVMWATEDPHEGFNILFSLHPYHGPAELGMYFAEEPKLLTEQVIQHEKSTYDKPDKWTGASPYEEVLQHQDTLIVLYDIEPNVHFQHISAYFSRKLAVFEEDDSGWIFVRGGNAWIAYYPLAPYTWSEDPGGDRRLHSTHAQNGAVVQVASARAFPTLEAFQAAILALPLTVEMDAIPRVRFQGLAGVVLEHQYGHHPSLDGEPVDYKHWPLFEGPFMKAEKDSRELVLQHRNHKRTLDFKTFTILDETT